MNTENLRRKFVEFTSERETTLGFITVTPVLVLFTLSALLPILWAIAASFNTVPVFSTEWTFVGLENYTSIITEGKLPHAFLTSAIYAVGTTGLEVLLGIGIALAINKQFRGIGLVRTIVLAPYLLPTVVVAILFQFMGTRFGIFNSLLLDLNLIKEAIPFFNVMPWAFLGVILASVWKFTLFVVLMTLARLQQIPTSYYEAAKLSGASSWEMFRDITFPEIKGIVLIVLLLRGVWMFNKFDVIWILTQGGPSDATTVLPIYAYKTAFVTTYDLGKASAIAVVGFVVLSIVAAIYFWKFKPTEQVST